MRDETKENLDKLMDTYEQKRESAEERAKRKIAEEAKFLASFRQCCDQTILPVMREIGEQLRSRGHAYNISSTDEVTPPGGRTMPAQAAMEFYPAGIDRSRFTSRTENTPYVAFIGNRDIRKVSVSSGDMIPDAGGRQGPVREVSLDEIDEDFVEEHILIMLRGVVGK